MLVLWWRWRQTIAVAHAVRVRHRSTVAIRLLLWCARLLTLTLSSRLSLILDLLRLLLRLLR